MYIYSKSSLEDYPLNTKPQILQTAARIAPNSELYIKMGDFGNKKEITLKLKHAIKRLLP